MHIFNITNTTFSSGMAAAYHTNPIKQNSDNANAAQKVLYEDIKNFMDKNYDKNVYIKNFLKSIKNSNNNAQFSNIEQDYIRTIMMTLDSAESIDDIPDGYLKWLMNNLLARKGYAQNNVLE